MVWATSASAAGKCCHPTPPQRWPARTVACFAASRCRCPSERNPRRLKRREREARGGVARGLQRESLCVIPRVLRHAAAVQRRRNGVPWRPPHPLEAPRPPTAGAAVFVVIVIVVVVVVIVVISVAATEESAERETARQRPGLRSSLPGHRVVLAGSRAQRTSAGADR